MDSQWHTWINSNMLTKSDMLEGDFLSVKEYFYKIFKSVIIPQLKNKKIITIYEDINQLTERALNVYFWIWIAFNKNRNHPYIFKSHCLNSIYDLRNKDILEYLESHLFPIEFWDNIKNICALGYFSPELSDFGKIFWDTLPEFIMGHINLEYSSGLALFFNNSNNSNNSNDIVETGNYINNNESRNTVDPYVSDYFNTNQYP
jgi:hypothetical protein